MTDAHHTDEMLDIYDDNLAHLGVKARAAVHRDGDWHRVFHCWVIYRDEAGRDRIVFQRRAMTKDTFPGKLDVSAAGHYAAGETIRDGLREVREELGINVAFDALVPAGKRVSAARDGAIIDREVADVFFLIDGRPLDAYAYDREELDGLVMFDIADGIALFAGDCESIPAQAVGWRSGQIEVQREQFILTVDAYVHKVLLLARRCLNGERQLLI